MLFQCPFNLTWKLVFLVGCTSFGTWFPSGYVLTSANAIQPIVIAWIRSVKCHRLSLSTIAPNNLTLTENGTYELWCASVSRNETELRNNAEINTIWALIGSMVNAGCFIGLWITSLFISRFGNKIALFLTSIISIVGTGLCAGCVIGRSFEMLILGRLVMGIYGGMVGVLVPIYIAEVCPASLRGAMATMPLVFFNLGMLAAVVFGMPGIFGTEKLWPLISCVLTDPGTRTVYNTTILSWKPSVFIAKKDWWKLRKKSSSLAAGNKGN